MFNPFAGGKPAPQLEAFARLVEAAFWDGAHKGAVWGFVAGAIAGAIVAALVIRTRQQESQP